LGNEDPKDDEPYEVSTDAIDPPVQQEIDMHDELYY
jgi:hypothetical protein